MEGTGRARNTETRRNGGRLSAAEHSVSNGLGAAARLACEGLRPAQRGTPALVPLIIPVVCVASVTPC